MAWCQKKVTYRNNSFPISNMADFKKFKISGISHNTLRSLLGTNEILIIDRNSQRLAVSQKTDWCIQLASSTGISDHLRSSPIISEGLAEEGGSEEACGGHSITKVRKFSNINQSGKSTMKKISWTVLSK